jgi:IS30 family transposase
MQERNPVPTSSPKMGKYNKHRNFLTERGYIANRVDIEERLAILGLKKTIKDLEIDTVIGNKHKGAPSTTG